MAIKANNDRFEQVRISQLNLTLSEVGLSGILQVSQLTNLHSGHVLPTFTI